MIDRRIWLAEIGESSDLGWLRASLGELYAVAPTELDVNGGRAFQDVVDCILACKRRIKEIETEKAKKAKGGRR